MINIKEDFNNTAAKSGEAQYQMALRPYRSASSGAQKAIVGATSLVCLGVAIAFTKAGAGPLAAAFIVPPLGIGLALRATNKDIKEYETVSIEDSNLIIEHYLPRQNKMLRTSMKASWASVNLITDEKRSVEDRILIGSHGKPIEIGAYLPPDQRKLVADRLSQVLSEFKKHGKIKSKTPSFIPPPRDKDAPLW